ncbi:putative molybdopterin biosynthesis protein [Desulfosalsimonas propionicica]|uniref:Molybdopterin molybdenumtransferase n=1 Tax=Desulfosalsimonas propionicica TaxID=332175 RepID=A0A7W0HKG2_9BACT|nr:molybdopterin biosynthesis protein [Desulfosalsimonas propionicica]MBA2881163.1 putative molybdopterin biosynthesis protein [Desulfosalsimonas propionicica]
MSSSRNIYLKMKTLREARDLLSDRFALRPAGRGETVAVTKAAGRILAQPVYARLSSPGFHAAAMDGVAVKAEATFGATEANPKILDTGTRAVFVNTGHIMPANTNAVIMIEDILVIDENRIQIEAPAFPWQHVRRMGEDIVATELLFARHHRITAYCIGALLTGGITEVSVLAKPCLFLLPTGPELVDHRQMPEELAPGRVIESNSHVLGQMAKELGAQYIRHDIVTDNFELISQTVSEAAQDPETDMILIMGGSSSGSEDFARQVIESLGEVHVHGVAMMPGKPVVIGEINGKPAFGIPGYPVSAIMAFEQFVTPLICAMLGRAEPEPEIIHVQPTRKIAGRLGMEQFVRVKLGKVGANIVATPLPRGAGTITSITEAHGIIRIDADKEGIREDDTVSARLLKDRRYIEDTIVAVGSHDNAIDVLADLLRAESSRYSLSSSHVGSMGGLMAVKKGLCHFAGTHLLDTHDGTYNISYIQKFLPDVPVRLVRLAEREQGLIVAPGNPKKLSGITDLARDDVVFVNRQSGSGTRVLLDFHLRGAGVDPAAITGYENEEFTHMAVAVAVLGRAADAGLGIRAAARALDLDFIPVATESYELVIPEAFAESGRIRLLTEMIGSAQFIERLHAMGGYHTQNTGRVVWKSHQ